MTKAVRYFSKLGNTKTIAEAIAEGAGVEAISIIDEPELMAPVDILYLGGAPYANIMAPELKKYAEGLNKEKVGKVILFTTSNWLRRTVLALKKLLKAKGICVGSDYFYAHMLHVKGRLHAAREFGKNK
ncbi:MAG: flavodoxin [Clostridia bacterium]|nr:flavodoxin [Clostridia bacterium]